MDTVAVLGLGNLLMQDDGVGPHVIRTLLRGWRFPPEVSLRDVGTPGPALVEELAGHRAVVVVDALRHEAPPGTVLRVEGDVLLDRLPSVHVSPHQPTLGEAFASARFLGVAPETLVLVGVVPAVVQPGTQLSPPVASAVLGAARAVVLELGRLGIRAVEREAGGEGGDERQAMR